MTDHDIWSSVTGGRGRPVEYLLWLDSRWQEFCADGYACVGPTSDRHMFHVWLMRWFMSRQRS